MDSLFASYGGSDSDDSDEAPCKSESTPSVKKTEENTSKPQTSLLPSADDMFESTAEPDFLRKNEVTPKNRHIASEHNPTTDKTQLEPKELLLIHNKVVLSRFQFSGRG